MPIKRSSETGSKPTLTVFLELFIPGLIVIILLLVFIFLREDHLQNLRYRENEIHNIDLAQSALAVKLITVTSDLLFLSQFVSSYAGSSYREMRIEAIQRLFVNFSNSKKVYDQIRLLDINGMEVVRINLKDGEASIVPENDLQQKKSRYYFQKSIRLGGKEIYVSPFDLNAEYGKVERPLKPVMRFATPVFNKYDRKIGVLILNFIGQNMLIEFDQHFGGTLGFGMLLNQEGYFLKGPRAEDEWGFMYTDRMDRTFKNKFPQEWQQVLKQQKGQFQTEKGLFTFDSFILMQKKRFHLPDLDQKNLKVTKPIIESPIWKVVCFVPKAIQTELIFHIARKYLILATTLTLLLFGGALARAKTVVAFRKTHFALEVSEKAYKDLYDNAPAAYFSIRAKDGLIVRCNLVVEKMLGFTIAELKQMKIFDLFVQTLHNRSVFNNVFKKGWHQAAVENIEMQLRCKDGRPKWGSISITPVKSNEGHVMESRVVIIDITQQYIADEALRDSENRLKAIFNTVKVGIVIFEAESNLVISANPAALRMIGVSKDQLIGFDWFEFTCWIEDNHCQTPTLDRTIIDSEAAIVNKVGAYVPVLKTTTPISIKAKDHFLESFMNISDLVEARRAVENASQSKSEFLSNMSHEIRTPLNGINGVLTLLRQTRLDSEQRHFVNTIESSAESLLHIVNDILDLSKIEAGKLEIESIDFDLHALLDDVASMMSTKIHKKGLEFICIAAPDIPVFLVGDPGRLRQILINLVGNAVKFTESGEIIVQVTIADETDDQIVLKFSIKDTGIGILAEKQALIFDNFTQVDASTTRKFGGTGLGLSISKKLCEAMGGEMGVKSKENEGTEFWFTTKLVKQDAPYQVLLSDEDQDLLSKRLLIVDDNASNRDIMLLQLRSLGFEVAEADKGPVALKRLRQAQKKGAPFDMAIIDMQMPEMDGIMLGKRIKADQAIQNTRLIMMTTMEIAGQTKLFKRIGFSAYIVKPVRCTHLIESLKLVVTGRFFETLNQRPETDRKVSDLKKRDFRILLAEDDLTNQEVAVGILKNLGFLNIDVVDNGKKAVNAVLKENYDLILMDIQMPEMDGLTATREIRKAGLSKTKIPIVAMTAHAMKGDRDRCMQAGMNAYLTKPVNPEYLVEILNQWLAEESVQFHPKSDGLQEDNGVEPPAADGKGKADTGIFDQAQFLERLMGDRQLAERVVTGFLEDMPKQIESLEDYILKNDSQASAKQAHKIKGAFGNIGSRPLKEIAFELEKAGKTEDVSKQRALIRVLKEKYIQLADTMKAMII
jgi:PAS domain S-box-containing protein